MCGLAFQVPKGMSSGVPKPTPPRPKEESSDDDFQPASTDAYQVPSPEEPSSPEYNPSDELSDPEPAPRWLVQVP